MKQYLDYIMEQLENLMAIDSPSGFTEKVTDYLLEEYKKMGYEDCGISGSEWGGEKWHEMVCRLPV